MTLVGTRVVRAAHRHRTIEDEVDPVAFGVRHVLDHATHAQLAHRAALGGLLVGQVPRGVAQEEAVLAQRLKQIGALG
ncbi:hypothetical protein GCM10029963_04140 [Micromonospora andamanensis]